MVNVNSRLAHAGFTLQKAQELYGVLGRYKTLLSVPLIIVTALGTTVLPAVAAAMALKNKKDVRKRTGFAFRVTFIVTIPAAIGLSCLASEVFELLYGTSQGYELMMIGSIVLVIQAIVQIQTTILQSMNKLYFVLFTFSLGIVAKIIANFVLVGIPSINILGVVGGNFLWFLIPMILNQMALNKTLRMRIPFFKHMIKPFISSLAMAGVLFVLKQPASIILSITSGGKILSGLITIIIISIGGFVYLYLMIILGGLNKKDMDSISGRIYRILPRFMRKRMR